MTIQRIADLTAPPVVGKFYLVPAIQRNRMAVRTSKSRWWPVIGPKHEDKEHFNFPHEHFHFDARFLTKVMLAEFWARKDGGKLGSALAQPLIQREMDDLPAPVLYRFRCTRSHVDYPFYGSKPVIAINEEWAGKQALRAKSDWICPHRNALIGTFEPDEHGIITCPLHGLRIDAATGKCVGPLTAQKLVVRAERNDG